MKRSIHLVSAAGLVWIAGCGGAASSSASRADTPGATGEPHALASASAASASAAPSAQAGGPLGWADFPGPHVKKELAAPQIWVTRPVAGDTFDVLGIYVADRLRAEGTAQLIHLWDGEAWIPNALVAPLSTLAPKVGDRALFQLNSSFGGTYGRVVAVGPASPDAPSDACEPPADPEGPPCQVVTVRSHIVSTVEDHEVGPRFVIPLDGKPTFGAPVAYEEADMPGYWAFAILVHPGPGKAWVLGTAGDMNEVDPARLHLVDVLHVHAVGAKVFASHAARGGRLGPGTVSGVLEDGLRYTVAFDPSDGGGEETMGFEEVTPPFAAATRREEESE